MGMFWGKNNWYYVKFHLSSSLTEQKDISLAIMNCILQCRKTAAGPSDRIDNDCDGRFDEESLNGKDDDADGLIDEDFITVGL